MATTLLPGFRLLNYREDEESHREYQVRLTVEAAPTDGLIAVRTTVGLPAPGAVYSFDGETDSWAFRRPEVAVQRAVVEEPSILWWLDFTYSTRPVRKCQDEGFQDPLLEPQHKSGTFQKYTEEATVDRFGNPVHNSAHEQIRGPQNEWDATRSAVEISQNVAALQYELWFPMSDTLNDAPLWGLPARSIKMTPSGWEEKFYGLCYKYYTRKFRFEARVKLAEDGVTLIGDWDRDLLDEGTKVLNGHWDGDTWSVDEIDGVEPDPANPAHFIRAKDRQGENIKLVLNGRGLPAEVLLSSPYFVALEDSTGVPLDTLGSWIPQVGGDTMWDVTEAYVAGNVVMHEGELYIAMVDSTGQNPATEDAFWRHLPDGIEDRGVWAEGRGFLTGDRVTNPDAQTSAGSIHVEKYKESNFLLLGIPLTI